MFGLITRFLPGVGPALSALLNPWVLVTLLAVSSGIFLYGLHIGEQRSDALLAAQAKLDKGRKAVIKYIVQQQVVIDQDTVNDLKARNTVLVRDNADLSRSLLQHIHAYINIPSSTGRDAQGDRVYVDRRKLVAGVQDSLGQFVQEHQPTVERGDRALILLRGCMEFTEKQHNLTQGIPVE